MHFQGGFLIRAFIIGLILVFSSFCYADSQYIPSSYAFKFIPNQWLTMPDGTKLSVSYWKPIAKTPTEKFPTVVEILPYRKDDSGYTEAYGEFSYLARRGIACARVDIRGTGSSEGITPDREYSDAELMDIPNILKQISKQPWSNGNIGMQGKSWSAFNSLMIGRQPPAELKSLLVAHGSDDLYANDIHNIDGALHIDIFTIEIDIDNILPRSSDYKIDEKYFSQRFNQTPWIFTYLKHQRDGIFWQSQRSLQTDYTSLKIPTFVFASLLDGYRDYAIHMLDNVKAPLKVNIGPQNHSWPNGEPGPSYEWRQLAARWWQETLNNKNYDMLKKPNVTLFHRDFIAPNLNLQNTSGTYTTENWPISATPAAFILTPGHLSKEKTPTAIESLIYKASNGAGTLNWWGETTPDMQNADKQALIYDSTPLTTEMNLLGNATITLRVATNAPLADWIVRLEDVSPDGKVSFITGALRNGTQRYSRINPQAIPKNKFFTLTFPLHFSTWKFLPHHKIRLVISNAQFPMIWPTPYKMTTQLQIGDGSSRLVLPIATSISIKPTLPAVEPYEKVPNAKDLKITSLSPFKITHNKNRDTIATAQEGYDGIIHGTRYQTRYKVAYKVNDAHPENASFFGEGEDTVRVANSKRIVRVKAITNIHSDLKYFYVSVLRQIFENGKLIRTKQWNEKIPRDWQ